MDPQRILWPRPTPSWTPGGPPGAPAARLRPRSALRRLSDAILGQDAARAAPHPESDEFDEALDELWSAHTMNPSLAAPVLMMMNADDAQGIQIVMQAYLQHPAESCTRRGRRMLRRRLGMVRSPADMSRLSSAMRAARAYLLEQEVRRQENLSHKYAKSHLPSWFFAENTAPDPYARYNHAPAEPQPVPSEIPDPPRRRPRP